MGEDKTFIVRVEVTLEFEIDGPDRDQALLADNTWQEIADSITGWSAITTSRIVSVSESDVE